MKLTRHLAQLNADGCKELPFVNTATQTYYDYLNGTAGYIVFALGAGLLLYGIVNRKKLSTMPAWMGGIFIAALALGALPVLLPAFGIDLGCGGGADTGGVVTEAPAPIETPAPVEVPEPAATPAEDN